jgi:class 3 adenylate cyclase
LLVAESVELATILLTDLVGSTRLANSVGPVRADELREEHFELLRDAIASSGGSEVKNTGDGLMVAFSSASAAVQCAVTMQQLFERRYRDAEQALHVRIGLAAGESTVKDGDYFGAPSIEAARLNAEAPADGILISGMGKALAGRCEGVEFSSVGELELKGFPDPVEAFSVSWEPLAQEVGEPAGRWPLPALLRSVPPVKYVGRVEERAALEEAMKIARARQRQVVLLSGEPGIGKTRLASYAAHNAHADGFAVAWGACTEELAVPYEPWIGVCSQLVEHAPEELIAGHLERHGGELSRVARNLDSRGYEVPAPQSSDPETERYLLFKAVAGLLAEVAGSVSVCVVLDDLHWADAQSLALLKHLLRSTEQAALEVIITYRDSDLGKDHPLTAVLADLRSLQGVQRLALHGLGADEVAEIMSAVAGHELEPDGVELAGQIAAETDGNPFFVGEILRGLSESGGLVFDEDAQRWSLDTTAGIRLPESVREVIERRVERLGEQSLEVLRLAAVIGREFDLELLSAVVEMDEGQLLDHLEAAVAASLLAESSEKVGRFRFAHALVNQTLYDGLGATRRARMHQRVAQALEALYGPDPSEHLAEFALHWRLAAVSIEKAKAANYASKAGQHALETLAPAEALKFFDDAVELLSEGESRERCEALIGLGEAQRQTGDPAHRETLLHAGRIASELGDAELAARAALANSRVLQSVIGELDDERLGAIERAIELDNPSNPARRARLLALKAVELTWGPDFTQRRALVDQAIALAREAHDERTLAEVLQHASFGLWTAETSEQRVALSEELLRIAATLGDPALRFWSHEIEHNVQIETGDFARAQTAREQKRLIAKELQQPLLEWIDAFSATAWETMRGGLELGGRMAEGAFQIGQEAGQADAVLVYGGQLAAVRFYEGRAPDVIEMLEQSVKTYPAIAAWRAALAEWLCWLERRDEAAALLAESARDGFQHVISGPARLATLHSYGCAAAMTSSAGPSSILYELIEPCADKIVWNSVTGYGHARTALGLLAGVLGRHQQADAHLAVACQFHEANDMPLWAARARLGWAEALIDRGDPTTASEHAARALELCRQHGYGVYEPRAASLVETGSAAGT